MDKLLKNYEDKTYIIYFPSDLIADKVDWTLLRQINVLTKKRLILCLSRYEFIGKAKVMNIPFYMGYEVNSYYEFNGLIEAGVEYIRIGAPLIFDCKFLNQYKDKIRFVPNYAYTGVKRKNGICGQWIRPENIDIYEDAIGIIEFEESSITAEETIFNLYKHEKKWLGDIQFIIHNFDAEGANKLIFSEELIKRRKNCKQRC